MSCALTMESGLYRAPTATEETQNCGQQYSLCNAAFEVFRWHMAFVGMAPPIYEITNATQPQ